MIKIGEYNALSFLNPTTQLLCFNLTEPRLFHNVTNSSTDIKDHIACNVSLQSQTWRFMRFIAHLTAENIHMHNWNWDTKRDVDYWPTVVFDELDMRTCCLFPFIPTFYGWAANFEMTNLVITTLKRTSPIWAPYESNRSTDVFKTIKMGLIYESWPDWDLRSRRWCSDHFSPQGAPDSTILASALKTGLFRRWLVDVSLHACFSIQLRFKMPSAAWHRD